MKVVFYSVLKTKCKPIHMHSGFNTLAAFIIVFFLFLTTSGQNTVGVIVNDTENAFEGYTLFSIHQDTYLINNCGEVINHWTSNYLPGNAVYLLEDGSILRAGKIENPDIPYAGIGGIVEKIDWNNNVTWQFTWSSPTYTQHHDTFPMPNGNVLLLVAEVKSEAGAIEAGRDPANIPDGRLYTEKIIEISPNGFNGGDIIWEWDIWDHLIQDIDNTKSNFGDISQNPQLLDINYLGRSGGHTDWLHINSVQYNADLDQLLLSVHGLDEIYIIDHSTTTVEAASHSGGLRGMGGDILYRWGNPQAYDQGIDEDRQLFGQHYPHWIPASYPDGDKIIIFNNGNGREENFSTIDIIIPPVDEFGNYAHIPGTSFLPEQPDWTYTAETPTDFYSKIISGAQRLPNGNTLICEGTSGRFFEVNPAGTTVWEYINPETTSGTIMEQGETPEGNNVFRALRYPTDYPAFIGKDLTPGTPVEMNPDLSPCQEEEEEVEEEPLSAIIIYPSPVKTTLFVDTLAEVDRIEIYNSTGVFVKKNEYTKSIDLSGVAPGIYFVRVFSAGKILDKKIIKN